MSLAARGRAEGWLESIGAILFIVFCLEIGIFLLIFPWMAPWHNNWLASWLPWGNPYFRGGLSGIGALDVYIGLSAAVRLRRSG